MQEQPMNTVNLETFDGVIVIDNAKLNTDESVQEVTQQSNTIDPNEVEVPREVRIKRYMERLIYLYREIKMLQDDVKEIKNEMKEKHYQHIVIAKAAKVIADDKTASTEDSLTSLMKMVDLYEQVEE